MTRFSDLPPELRFQIWDFALKHEAHDRLLIIFKRCAFSRLLVFRHNASSFLSVNCESRNRAQAFYSVKLPVYEITKEQSERYPKSIRYSDITIVEGLRKKGVLKGALYFSLQWDIFVTIPDNDAVLSYVKAKLEGSFFGTQLDSQMTPCCYLTGWLLDEITTKISNVACVQEQKQNINDEIPTRLYSEAKEGYDLNFAPRIPHTIRPFDVYFLWSVFEFRAIKNYQHLGLTEAGMGSFIFNVVEHGGRSFYEFRDMVVYPNEHNPGTWVLIDPGELQKQNRKLPEPELKLKPYACHNVDCRCRYDWRTTRQIKGYETSDPHDHNEPTQSPT